MAAWLATRYRRHETPRTGEADLDLRSRESEGLATPAPCVRSQWGCGGFQQQAKTYRSATGAVR